MQFAVCDPRLDFFRRGHVEILHAPGIVAGLECRDKPVLLEVFGIDVGDRAFKPGSDGHEPLFVVHGNQDHDAVVQIA